MPVISFCAAVSTWLESCVSKLNIAFDSSSVKLEAVSIFSFTFSTASIPLPNTVSNASLEVTLLDN